MKLLEAPHLDVAVYLALRMHVLQAARAARAHPRNFLLRQWLLKRTKYVAQAAAAAVLHRDPQVALPAVAAHEVDDAVVVALHLNCQFRLDVVPELRQ